MDALKAMIPRVGKNFATACELILACKGRTIVMGMGKSGHISHKIAATFASTGTPAFFVHPGEASHGDMGMITSHDVVIALSNSGETTEFLTILPRLKRLTIPLITLTGNPQSTLAKAATVNLDVSVEKEACPLGLAPTTSSTATLVMGDALAIALLEARGFTAEDFALSHPGGQLGRRLLLRIEDIMRTGDKVPIVYPNASLKEALMEMTRKGLGMTGVVDNANKLLGIFTDGDLRRTIDKALNFNTTLIHEVMTPQCKTITPERLAAEALQEMEQFKITSLFVLDDSKTLVGALHLHDLLRAGVV
ncbi:MAG: KpsF/GutQ family sugar-phosphate isomerase [Gammaproteobacteria bacterium]